jgi:hypothetical protein
MKSNNNNFISFKIICQQYYSTEKPRHVYKKDSSYFGNVYTESYGSQNQHKVIGPHNQAYVFNELLRMDIEGVLPLSIMLFSFCETSNNSKIYNNCLPQLDALTKILSKGLRENDIIRRLGQESFIIVFPGTYEMDALKIAYRIKKSLEIYGNIQNNIFFGIATKVIKSQNIWAVYKIAETRMYYSKQTGNRGHANEINHRNRELHE